MFTYLSQYPKVDNGMADSDWDSLRVIKEMLAFMSMCCTMQTKERKGHLTTYIAESM